MADQVLQMVERFQELGLSEPSARYLVTEQGMSNATELATTKEADITNMCKSCRKPGGTIPGPRAGARAPARIPNPGNPIAVIHEQRIKCVAFYLKYRLMTSRVLSVLDITRDNAEKISDYKLQVDTNVNPESDKAPKLTPNKIFEFFDEFADYLQEHVGPVSQRPLGYVVRDNLEVRASATDPPYGMANSR